MLRAFLMDAQFAYKDFLLREFRLRKRRNAAYSMKAFARDLGLQDSKLSEILSGKKGLSVDRARRVAGALRLNVRDTDLFITMVMANHSRSPAEKVRALQTLKQKAALRGAVIEAERFRMISDWEHLAILEVLVMKEGADVESLKERFGLERRQVEAALYRLKAVGLVEQQGEVWKALESALETSDDIPSRAIREHHYQMLAKSQAALDLDVELREFQTLMMSFDAKEMTEAKQFLRNSLNEFAKRFAAGTSGQNVYAIGIQFFPLDKAKRKSKKGPNQ